jgi:dihydrofolate reductase
MLRAILHADSQWGIGKKNDLMFSLPKDMKFFRTTTKGHTVAMGENTLISFPNSQPLKNRTNIVLSQDETHNYEGVVNVHSFDEFLKTIKEYMKKDDVYIIGGASIYRQMVPYCDEVLLTKVKADGKAEVFFPNLDEDPNYEMTYASKEEEDNGLMIQFTTYTNKNPLKL